MIASARSWSPPRIETGGLPFPHNPPDDGFLPLAVCSVINFSVSRSCCLVCFVVVSWQEFDCLAVQNQFSRRAESQTCTFVFWIREPFAAQERVVSSQGA